MGKSLAELWDQASQEFRRRPDLVRNRYEELLLQNGYKPIRPDSTAPAEAAEKATEAPLRGVEGDDTYEPPERLHGH